MSASETRAPRGGAPQALALQPSPGTPPPGRSTAGEPAPGGRCPRSLWLRVLRGSLFYKLVVASALVVGLATGLASYTTVAAARSGGGAPDLRVGLGFATAAAAAGFLLDGVLLRTALRPHHLLEAAATRIRHGPIAEVAPLAVATDQNLERLIRVFNGMVQGTAACRGQLRQLTVRALEAVGATARTLHPPELEELAVVDAMRARARSEGQARAERQASGVEVSVEAEAAETRRRRDSSGSRSRRCTWAAP